MWIALLVVLVAVTAIRIPRLDLPLERDEGEYAYAGQLLREGVTPYESVYNMKLPGVYVAYAAIMSVFGESPAGIRLGLLLLNLVTATLIFLLALRLFGGVAAVASAGAFALLSLLQSVVGFWAHSEHFVIAFAVAGLTLLERALARKSVPAIAASGLLLGMAFVMKQHGALFILAGALWILAGAMGKGKGGLAAALRPLAAYAAGAVLPFAAVCLWMLAAGAFTDFWFWTFTYAREYVSNTTAEQALLNLWGVDVDGNRVAGTLPRLIGDAPLVWIAVAAGALLLAFGERRPFVRPRMFVLVACSLLAILPGFHFRDHYFLYALPAAALLFGVAVGRIDKAMRGAGAGTAAMVAAGFAAVVLGSTLLARSAYLYRWSNEEVMEAAYGRAAFAASPALGAYIRDHSGPGDTVAVLGSEPQIYFYAGRRAATGFIYTYPLMERHPHALRMQRQMIEEIERSRPRFLVFVNDPFSWLAGPESHREIFTWSERYIAQNYGAAAIAEIGPRTEIVTGTRAEGHQLRSDVWVGVFERTAQ